MIPNHLKPIQKPTLQQINETVIDFAGHPEHYKFLAWVSLQYNDITIVEIGTHKGYGTQALAHNKRNKVISFDIKTREGSIETPENAVKKMVYDGYMDEVLTADIIFYDAKHEGKEEMEFFRELWERDWRGLLILDDIHFNDPMKKFWEEIPLPKEDWTDIAHSPSGTGVVSFCVDMIQKDYTFEYFLNKIKNNIPFKFMRFGDGEFLVAKGTRNKTIAKGEHDVFPEITKDILSILHKISKTKLPESHEFFGLQGLSQRLININRFIPNFTWCDSDVFHRANMEGKFSMLFETLRDKNVVIISSAKMREIKKHIPYNDFIEVREKNCWWDKEEVKKKIMEYPSNTIFILCASRLSTPLIYQTERIDCTFIDIGSALDPWVGIHSRTYHTNVII